MDYRKALMNIILNDYANSGESTANLLAMVLHGTKGVRNMELDELEQEVFEMCSDDLDMDGIDTTDRERLKEWVTVRARRIPNRLNSFAGT